MNREAATLAPNQTFTITLDYSDANIGFAIEDTFALYYWNGVAWVKEATSSVDTVNNILTATPKHLSLWAVYGETKQVYLPLLAQNYCRNFFDDFSDPGSGWYTGEDNEGRIEYQNGEYGVPVKPENYYFILGAPACDRQNYIVGWLSQERENQVISKSKAWWICPANHLRP